MSNAIDALNSLTDDQISAYIAKPESEPHIVINDDRKITVPDSLKRIAVQFDHNIETVTFDCPRYWDNHDMSQMKVYINYRLPDGSLDSYIVDNVIASDDIMNFDWTIKENVTQQKGNITFLVCVKKVDPSGNQVNHWNSELCSDLFVSEGLECIEQIVADHPDLITQLLTRMDTVEQINVQADEMRELLDEVTTAAEEANTAKEVAVEARVVVEESAEEIRNLYSNAIVNSASGEMIQVDDVSPIKHAVKAKVRSKNLIPFPYDEADSEKNGVTFTVLPDGGLQMVGTPTINVSFNFVMQYRKKLLVEKGKTYTISVTSTLSDARGYVFIQNWANGEVVDNKSLRQGSLTFVAGDDGSIQIGIVLIKGQTFDEIAYIHFEEGDTATDYTPYVDLANITLTRCGKNLASNVVEDWDVPYYFLTINDGVMEGLNSNGASNYMYMFAKFPKGVYVANAEFQGDVRYLAKLYSADGTVLTDNEIHGFGAYNSYYKGFYFGDKIKVFDIPDGVAYWRFGLVFTSNNTELKDKYITISNVQLEVGGEASNYEEYTSTSHIPLPDGTVEGITSLSPAMTIFADKPGVIIDVEYNKDINAAFDELNTLLETFLNGGT